jgi:nitrogen fixation NifU-like protein
MDLSELYKEIILEHSAHPCNKKAISGDNVKSDKQENPVCGDKIELQLDISGGIIKNVGWQGEGCAISQSSVSVMTNLIKGKTVDDTKNILLNFENMLHEKPYNSDVLKDAVLFEGVKKFPMRIKCAYIGYKALKEII